MMNMDSLSAIFVVLLGGWLWLITLHAHEQALAHARRACERAGVQMLDQAVALRAVALRWTGEGLRLRRTYRFEFSEAGVERRIGTVVMLGLRLEQLSLDRAPAEKTSDSADSSEPMPDSTESKTDSGEGRFLP